MIEEVRSIAARLGIAESRVHFERFSAEALSAQKEKALPCISSARKRPS